MSEWKGFLERYTPRNSRRSGKTSDRRRIEHTGSGAEIIDFRSTIRYWVKAKREGKLQEVGRQQRPLTEVEMELARVKRELAQVKMERDILKKAAAYFAKESLPGTRS